MDSTFYPVPGSPGAFTNAPFFIWYAPRIPHAPLRAPGVIGSYLFGTGMGGLLDLGAMCRGASCPPSVLRSPSRTSARSATTIEHLVGGRQRPRDPRVPRRKSAPHCIARGGQSRFTVNNPSQCPGTWATSIAPALDRNTIIIYLSDNGWFLPSSKHAFTENGYRTRLVVYDPRKWTRCRPGCRAQRRLRPSRAPPSRTRPTCSPRSWASRLGRRGRRAAR